MNPPGTLICDEEEIVEQQVVTGIAYAKDEAQISLRRVADRPGVAAGIFGPLAEANINVDMIVQNISEDGKFTDMTFTVPSGDVDKALAVLDKVKADGRLRRHPARRGHVQGVGHRHRHAQPCRRRRHRFQGAGRQGDQHPGDHHLGDQDLDPDRRALHGTWRCALCIPSTVWISSNRAAIIRRSPAAAGDVGCRQPFAVWRRCRDA